MLPSSDLFTVDSFPLFTSDAEADQSRATFKVAPILGDGKLELKLGCSDRFRIRVYLKSTASQKPLTKCMDL
jgi:hypothetical protein